MKCIKIFSLFLTIAFVSFEAVAQELHINSVVPIPNKKEIACDTIYIIASLPDIEKSTIDYFDLLQIKVVASSYDRR